MILDAEGLTDYSPSPMVSYDRGNYFGRYFSYHEKRGIDRRIVFESRRKTVYLSTKEGVKTIGSPRVKRPSPGPFDRLLKKNRPLPDAAKLPLEEVPGRPWNGNGRIGKKFNLAEGRCSHRTAQRCLETSDTMPVPVFVRVRSSFTFRTA